MISFGQYLRKRMLFSRLGSFLGIALASIVLASCTKQGEVDVAPIKHPTADTSGDVRSVLAKSSFTLFKQAYNKANGDSLLSPDSYYTIFAPVDSAMQAAGLDAAHINSLSADSLKRFVLYHIVNGAYSAGALTSALCSVEATSLRQDVTYVSASANAFIYQQNLFLKKSGAVYINGEQATGSRDTAFSATNGYVWPIRTALKAPGQTLWQIINGRPELSMYLMALRINDSLYKRYGFRIDGAGFNSVAGDSASFVRMVYENQPQSFFYGRVRPTVFAPTNAAFAAAGLNSYSDLLAFALTSAPGVSYDENWNMIRNYYPLDSLIKLHVIINKDNKYTNMSLYNDFIFNPYMNNGAFNNVVFWQGQDKAIGSSYTAVCPQPAYPLYFSNTNGAAKIQWSPSMPGVILPADKSRHLMALNGVLYEIDQLFYPHN